MPIPAALLAAGISAAAGAGTAGIQAGATSKLNKKTMKWNEKMYGIQRSDALSDLANQNEYNSPAAQMARLKAAGLNPNLVYGNGATTESGTARGTDVKAWNPQTPDLSSLSRINPISEYQNYQLQTAQINQLNQLTELRAVDQALKIAQTAKTLTETQSKSIDVARATDLYEISLDYGKERLRNLQADTGLKTQTTDNARLNFDKILADIGSTRANTQYTLDQNERAAAQNTMSLREAYERILTSRLQRAKTQDERQEILARIENLKKDNESKEWDLKLKRKGIQPHDNNWNRVLMELLEMGTQRRFNDTLVDPVFPGIPRFKK